MKNRLHNCLSNEIGSFSIWYAMLALMMVTIISSSLGGFQKLRAINEIQGTVDVAGVSALRIGVDEQSIRDEILSINQRLVFDTFDQLVDKERLKRATQAKSIRMEQKIISKNVSTSPEEAIKEVYLITDTYMTFEHMPVLDRVVMTTLTYYDFFDNRDAEITITGNAGDGTQEIIVRSVSRLLLK